MAFKSTVLVALLAAGFIALTLAAPPAPGSAEDKKEKLETAGSYYYGGLGYPAYSGVGGGYYGGHGGYFGGYYPAGYSGYNGYLNAYPYAYDNGAYYNGHHSYLGGPYYGK